MNQETDLEPQRLAMIATDIDGTMLRSDGSLSDRVKASLADAVSAGIHVVPATGRPVMIAEDVIEAAELPHYWVFANGAITRHLGRDELVRGFWMEQDITERLVRQLRAALPGAGFAVEFEKTVSWEAGFTEVVPVVPDVAPSPDVLAEVTSEHPEYGRIQKILIFNTAVSLDDLYQAVKGLAGDDAVASYSGLPFIELAASEVTKATALQLLVDDLGIDAGQVACFGDNHNDLPMLDWAGRSYAMGNATDDAKAAATEVIGNNDSDGLAIKIEQLLSEL